MYDIFFTSRLQNTLGCKNKGPNELFCNSISSPVPGETNWTDRTDSEHEEGGEIKEHKKLTKYFNNKSMIAKWVSL